MKRSRWILQLKAWIKSNRPRLLCDLYISKIRYNGIEVSFRKLEKYIILIIDEHKFGMLKMHYMDDDPEMENVVDIYDFNSSEGFERFRNWINENFCIGSVLKVWDRDNYLFIGKENDYQKRTPGKYILKITHLNQLNPNYQVGMSTEDVRRYFEVENFKK